MKLAKEDARKLVKDGLISVVLYALPVLLMLLTFKITGQRPWEKTKGAATHQHSK